MKTVSSKLILLCIGVTMIGFAFANQSLAEIDMETCVGAWLFEDIAGKMVVDSSSAGNDGDIEGGPGLVNGVFGKAMDFNGSDDFIIIPDSDSLELEYLTMAAWVYLRSYPEDARILTQEVDGDPYSTYSIMMSGGGYTKFEFRISLDNVRQRIPTIADVPLETWTHVAATYDGEKAVLYINAEIDLEQPQSGTLLTTDNPLYIGASQFWTPRFFDGLMDEVTLFNVALDQDQIGELMNRGISEMMAVSSKGKLITTWAQLKRP
jgi:hypothetical protein